MTVISGRGVCACVETYIIQLYSFIYIEILTSLFHLLLLEFICFSLFGALLNYLTWCTQLPLKLRTATARQVSSPHTLWPTARPTPTRPGYRALRALFCPVQCAFKRTNNSNKQSNFEIKLKNTETHAHSRCMHW